MDVASGRGSWQPPLQQQQQQQPGRDDDDDDEFSSSAPLPVTIAKENMNPEKPAKDISKVAQTVASQLLCELALELD
jgi:hypothetical protein